MQHYGTEDVTTNLKRNIPSARYYQHTEKYLFDRPACTRR